jgi:hypothetical protein
MLDFCTPNKSVVNLSVLSLLCLFKDSKSGNRAERKNIYFINTEGSHVIRLGNMNINIIHANKPTRNG